jgi:hypothetical protein
MDESTESVIRLHGLEIRELEKKHNYIEMDLIGLDYEEITDYYNLLKGK